MSTPALWPDTQRRFLCCGDPDKATTPAGNRGCQDNSGHARCLPGSYHVLLGCQAIRRRFSGLLNISYGRMTICIISTTP